MSVLLAYAAIYLTWGSTYFAIRIGVSAFSPAGVCGLRFLIAAAIMAIYWRLRRHRQLAASAEVWRAFGVGLLMLIGGTGLVGYAERDVPSGVTALVNGCSPILFAVFNRLAGGPKLTKVQVLGGVLGFGGLVALTLPALESSATRDYSLGGVALLVLAACFWSGTSVYSKHLRLPKDPILSSTLQMIAGGVLMTVYGFAAGEMTPASIASAPPKIWGAIAYLAVIGSCLGFTAYSWLLLHQPANRVSSYAFVNPLVAVLLGVVWGREAFTWPIACALALIGVGVSISLFGDRWKKILKGSEKTAPLEAN